MSGFWSLSVFLFFGLFSCFSFGFQVGVVPHDVKLAKTAKCGEEVRSDDGILLPIQKNSIEYPDFLGEEAKNVFWVLITFDVGVGSVPKNISVKGDFSSDLKNYFKEKFSSWRFPPCVSNGEVLEIVGEQVLIRVSK